ncbi:hypothetical protein D3C87_947500 [compost metagenome]
MKTLIALAAVAAVSAPVAAFAADGNVAINGSVAAVCKFSLDNATISLGEMADGDGFLNAAVVNNKTATLTGWCNGVSSTMAVTATELTRSGAAVNAAGFTSRVDYTATAATQSASLGAAASANDTTVTAGAGAAANLGLFADNVTVTLTNAAPGAAGARLVAGSYTGNVKVTLTPAL